MLDQKLIDLHIENGYFIKVQRMKQANGIFVEYPKSGLVIAPADPFIMCYFVEDKKIKIMSEKERQTGHSKEIESPNYAIRTLIAEDILIQIIKSKISHELLFCFNKDGEPLEDINNLIDVLDEPPLEDRTNEKLFLNLLKGVLLGLDCSQQAQSLSLEEGYKIMKKIFDKGASNV